MPDISYTPTFQHEDWIDNEDVVQAGGEKGFNKTFHTIEDELAKIATAIAQLATAINQIQRLRSVRALPAQTLQPGTSSPQDIEIDQYALSEVAENTQKVYFTNFTFVPPAALGQVETYTHYRSAGPNLTRVTMVFKNTGTTPATFTTQVFTLA